MCVFECVCLFLNVCVCVCVCVHTHGRKSANLKRKLHALLNMLWCEKDSDRCMLGKMGEEADASVI